MKLSDAKRRCLIAAAEGRLSYGITFSNHIQIEEATPKHADKAAEKAWILASNISDRTFKACLREGLLEKVGPVSEGSRMFAYTVTDKGRAALAEVSRIP